MTDVYAPQYRILHFNVCACVCVCDLIQAHYAENPIQFHFMIAQQQRQEQLPQKMIH